MEIKRYLLDKGIKPHLKGFYYLEYAIELCKKDRRLVYQCMKLYEIIAKDCDDTPGKVERAIRHALENSNKKTKNSEFIGMALIELN